MNGTPGGGSSSCYREISQHRREEAVAKGYKIRHFFPHRFYYLPKCGPDAFKLAQRMLASSATSLGIRQPDMENGIVRVPILFDDFALYRHGMRYGEWERVVLARIEQHHFAAFGLHDCYAPFWLPEYPDFLRRAARAGDAANIR